MSRGRFGGNHFRHGVDANHRKVIEALRKFGAFVQSLASVGNGCPDLLVGYRGKTVLMEVKDGAKSPSARALTETEEAFFRTWNGGLLVIVESPEQAVDVLRGGGAMSETKDAGTAFGAIYEALDTIKEHLARGRQAEAERDALRAEVARLRWEAAGSPMQGEHAGDPTSCGACADGYPPPPGEPAPR